MLKDTKESQFGFYELTSIQKMVGWHAERTFIFQNAGNRYFIKKQRKQKIPFLPFLVRGYLGIFRGFLGILRVGFLAPALAYGGRNSLTYEVETLCKFRQNGVLVPNLIHVENDFIVLQAIDGQNVDMLMSDKKYNLMVWMAAASGIVGIHQKGHCLSQGFARNIMLVNGNVAFIDFEENPLLTMDIHKAQARDWIYFLLSTLWQFDSPELVLKEWRKFQDQVHPEVQKHLRTVSHRMAWLRFLPKNRKPWGRDVIQLEAMGRFFQEWNRLMELDNPLKSKV